MGGPSEATPVHNMLRVARLIPAAQTVATIQADTLVRDALELMRLQNFDQMPVVAGSRVIGVFSYRSLAASLEHLRSSQDPLDQRVEDALVDLEFVRASQDVGPIFQLLERDGAVLVGDEENLAAVMTLSDASSYLWQVTRPFVLIQDVELAVRSLMEGACVRKAILPESLVADLPDDRTAGVAEGRTLAQFSMGELFGVLFNGKNYNTVFREAFGQNRSIAASALTPVREIRNKVFHFRDEVIVEELEVLVAARQYLRRRLDSWNQT